MAKHYWLACVFTAAAACGGDDGGGGVAIDDFPSELANAQCANQVECGDMPDTATCLDALIFEGNDVETLIASVKDGTIQYDEGQAADCLDFIANQGCAFEGFYLDNNPCEGLFTGTLATGDTCFDATECAGTSDCTFADPNCDPSTACCTGTCATSLTEQQAGGPCDDNMNFCNSSLFCKPDAAGTGPGTCTTPNPTEGAACASIDECDSPAYCNIDFNTGTGTCTVPPGPNETCDPNELLPCADFSTYCDTVALKCTDNVGPGTACEGANGAICVGFAQCTNGSCVADGGNGDTCDSATGSPDCLGTLTCSGNVCVAPAPGIACN